jgi:hypothetical protein
MCTALRDRGMKSRVERGQLPRYGDKIITLGVGQLLGKSIVAAKW